MLALNIPDVEGDCHNPATTFWSNAGSPAVIVGISGDALMLSAGTKTIAPVLIVGTFPDTTMPDNAMATETPV